jgi:hypothetical protein
MRIRFPSPRQVFAAAASPHATVVLLLVVAALVVDGTLYEARHSLYDARRHIFDAWIVFFPPFIPFPGVKLAVLLLFINLLASGAARVRRSFKGFGLLCVHAGIASLFIGAGLGYTLRQESSLTLGEGESSASALAASEGSSDAARSVPLPLTVRLRSFVLKRAPGSGALEDYESRVHVLGSDIDRDAVISMNRPFRYRDFTFYQSSYQDNGGRMLSTLAIVRNPARILPYFAGILIAAGLIFHFLAKFAGSIRRKRA